MAKTVFYDLWKNHILTTKRRIDKRIERIESYGFIIIYKNNLCNFGHVTWGLK